MEYNAYSQSLAELLPCTMNYKPVKPLQDTQIKSSRKPQSVTSHTRPSHTQTLQHTVQPSPTHHRRYSDLPSGGAYTPLSPTTMIRTAHSSMHADIQAPRHMSRVPPPSILSSPYSRTSVLAPPMSASRMLNRLIGKYDMRLEHMSIDTGVDTHVMEGPNQASIDAVAFAVEALKPSKPLVEEVDDSASPKECKEQGSEDEQQQQQEEAVEIDQEAQLPPDYSPPPTFTSIGVDTSIQHVFQSVQTHDEPTKQTVHVQTQQAFQDRSSSPVLEIQPIPPTMSFHTTQTRAPTPPPTTSDVGIDPIEPPVVVKQPEVSDHSSSESSAYLEECRDYALDTGAPVLEISLEYIEEGEDCTPEASSVPIDEPEPHIFSPILRTPPPRSVGTSSDVGMVSSDVGTMPTSEVSQKGGFESLFRAFKLMKKAPSSQM
eukprot:gnl/Dysnectes_brevis/3936_a5129_844.p1 GENE.gnl/Dysnectes_brevis/3936_a5129_844~~gnl/Dysnectes_brevis/3936_a5129_844.p1  ORF type:complete len:430 (-),score=61.74 gnl/Dysnectes_brevis/3936_a5129_844:52-1341(-)